MLRGTTPSASAMVGPAVLRIVVSSDSIRNATATSQGSRRLTEGSGGGGTGGIVPRPSRGVFRGTALRWALRRILLSFDLLSIDGADREPKGPRRPQPSPPHHLPAALVHLDARYHRGTS